MNDLEEEPSRSFVLFFLEDSFKLNDGRFCSYFVGNVCTCIFERILRGGSLGTRTEIYFMIFEILFNFMALEEELKENPQGSLVKIGNRFLEVFHKYLIGGFLKDFLKGSSNTIKYSFERIFRRIIRKP